MLTSETQIGVGEAAPEDASQVPWQAVLGDGANEVSGAANKGSSGQGLGFW